MSLHIACRFAFVNFNILSLFLIVPIYLQCVSVVFFGLAIFGILCSFELDACFLYQVRKVFCYYVFKNVLCPFHSLLFFRDPPITRILVQLIFSRRLLKLFSFLIFFIFLLKFSDFCYSFFQFADLFFYHLIYSQFFLVFFFFF